MVIKGEQKRERERERNREKGMGERKKNEMKRGSEGVGGRMDIRSSMSERE
jgi:hypothetical protein